MELTGQCEYDFTSWIINQEFWDEELDFDSLHFLFKIGVYDLFFESLDIHIDIDYNHIDKSYEIYDRATMIDSCIESQSDAWEIKYEFLNNIYNERDSKKD